ncbi:hypothetical protein OGZ37_11275 [Lactococcus lactis]|uniref:hypothetical protein n=1 Tax=Lactococcus lactis TaxID=1358 RepID=UPI002418AEAB|nr:hypothetical protein [Lactococcus lactis]MDG4967143.1 hypothetical protein [Lactococcus lactis]
MTIIKENQNDTGVMTFTFRFIKREDMPYPNYTDEEIEKIVDVLGRAVLKDIWDSLETEEDRAYFRSINGPLFDKEKLECNHLKQRN